MATYGEMAEKFWSLADVEGEKKNPERGNPAVAKAPNTQREHKWDEWKILLTCTIKNKCCFHVTQMSVINHWTNELLEGLENEVD